MIWGFERLEAGATLPRHRHAEPHVTLVLAGTYSEVGDEGRWIARTGDVLVHHPYAAHSNGIAACGARVLNLPVRTATPSFACGRCIDVDAVASLAEGNLCDAATSLLENTRKRAADSQDWPDALAAYLKGAPDTSIGDWALEHGLARESVSRLFRSAFGLSPKRFRSEARALAAWREILETNAPLASIAAGLGFADQAHMTRAVAVLTGVTPGAWRKEAHARKVGATVPNAGARPLDR